MVLAMTEQERRPGMLDRALRVFADVKAGEGASTLMLALSIFLLMVSYYVIKIVREPWILTMGDNGAQLKAYASAVQAAALMFYVPRVHLAVGALPQPQAGLLRRRLLPGLHPAVLAREPRGDRLAGGSSSSSG